MRLTQGGRSVTNFAIEFQTLAAACGWNDAALRTQFLNGLSDEIQNEIAAHDVPGSMDTMIELALRVESRMSLHRHRRTWRHHTSLGETANLPSSAAPLSPVEGEPMQLGRMRLSQKERPRRLINGLCLYCGKPGHLAISCPLKATAHR